MFVLLKGNKGLPNGRSSPLEAEIRGGESGA